jgi:undecaprenyl-diphosphatase
MSVDARWYLDVHTFARQTGWLHGFMEWDAKYGVVVFALLLVAGYLVARRSADALRRVACDVWAALAVLAAVAIAQPISSAVARTRPEFALHVHALVVHARDYGFPSDHATAVGACAAGLWFVRRWLGALATLLALLLAFSRVYVGVHYPGDVAGGLVLGAVVALIGVLVVVPVLRHVAAAVARTPLRPLVAAPWARTARY